MRAAFGLGVPSGRGRPALARTNSTPSACPLWQVMRRLYALPCPAPADRPGMPPCSPHVQSQNSSHSLIQTRTGPAPTDGLCDASNNGCGLQTAIVSFELAAELKWNSRLLSPGNCTHGPGSDLGSPTITQAITPKSASRPPRPAPVCVVPPVDVISLRSTSSH